MTNIIDFFDYYPSSWKEISAFAISKVESEVGKLDAVAKNELLYEAEALWSEYERMEKSCTFNFSMSIQIDNDLEGKKAEEELKRAVLSFVDPRKRFIEKAIAQILAIKAKLIIEKCRKT